MDTSTILVFDNNDSTFQELQLILEKDFTLVQEPSTRNALDTLGQVNPDLIILRVNIPNEDGYVACQTIKDDMDFDSTPVLLLRGINDLENRIKAYEVGADDYVICPFNNEEMLTKAKTLIRHRRTTEQYKEQANGAMQQAMSIITSTGEMAYVIDFLRESYACKTIPSLAEKIVEVCASYNLNVLVRLALDKTIIFKGTNNPGSPLEKSLFDHIPPDIHIHEFNHRCVFNYGITSILVKNMPIDDPDKCGRIRDNIAIIAEGCNAAVKSIARSSILSEQRNHVSTLMEHSCQILELIDKKSYEQRINSTEIMTNLRTDIEDRFMHMGLSEDQEVELVETIKEAEEKQILLFKLGDMVEKHLTMLITEFEEVLQSNKDI